MSQASQRGPFLQLVVVCTAILAVLLNSFVLVIGGGFTLFLVFLFSYAPRSGWAFDVAVALCLMVIGLMNFQVMAHVFGQKERAGTRVFKVADVINGLLIAMSAYVVFTGGGRIEWGLVFATAAITLIAIHVGRSKPIPAGHCQTCGYDLAGLVDGVCPECGAAK